MMGQKIKQQQKHLILANSNQFEEKKLNLKEHAQAIKGEIEKKLELTLKQDTGKAEKFSIDFMI